MVIEKKKDDNNKPHLTAQNDLLFIIFCYLKQIVNRDTMVLSH